MSRIIPSEQKNQALREMFEQEFESGAERELMLSELIRLTTDNSLQEMLELEQSEHLERERYERGEAPAALHRNGYEPGTGKLLKIQLLLEYGLQHLE